MSAVNNHKTATPMTNDAMTNGYFKQIDLKLIRQQAR